MGKNLLLEIGTEELPARFIFPALNSLKLEAEKLFSHYRLFYKKIETGGTFRRLSLFVEDLAEKQTDIEEEITGPSVKIGLDENGNFTNAAIGFAKKHNVSPSDLKIKKTKKGEYFYIKKKILGKPTFEILPELILQLFKKIYFPKTMRWGTYNFYFGRPIRWILCLFGNQVVPIEIAGIKSDRKFFAHRFLSPNPLTLETADWNKYKELLKKHFVILSPEERIEATKKSIQEITENIGKAEIDEELLIENANLVEYPFPILGSFPQEFLNLPEELIIVALKEHQRYFCVRNKNGKLLNYFVAINNNLPKNQEVVKKGHEKVTKARLEDAKFYYEKDLKTPLEEMLKKLSGIVYHVKCGTLADKTERLVLLSEFLNEHLQLCPNKENLKKIARFSKVDLASEVVKEFPSLQGTMGWIYAKKEGLGDLAYAIYEQYLPLPGKNELPQTPEGIILALTDRIDHLCALFGVGEKPTGEKDPYGLRRSAYGIIKILIGKRLFLDLKICIEKALSLLENQNFLKTEKQKLAEEIISFLKGRLKAELLSQNYPKEIINCVIDSSLDIWEIYLKIKALHAFQKEVDFENFFIGFKRIVQILKNVDTNTLPEINPAYFKEQAEKDFYQKIKSLEKELISLYEERKYLEYLKLLGELKPFVDRFFDEVFVMTEDEKLRLNRLSLLNYAYSLFKNFGNFSVLI